MDYKATLILPTTTFPMKARLVDLEKRLMERWRKLDLQQSLQQASRQRKKKFILHDGPPYANGHIHMGHALNKILKDVINRSQFLAGKGVNYVPGWDCHGLPIEWKIEEELRAAGKNKEDMPVPDFRALCRRQAERWMRIQSEEFQRLGIIADWKNPYVTMEPQSQASIIRILGDLLCQGHIVRGVRPVMWSIVEKTALAEAEVDYKPHRSKTVMVAFVIRSSPIAECVGASVVIWTTTPWTLPGNRAIACHGDFPYILLKVKKTSEKCRVPSGTRIMVAEELCEHALGQMGIESFDRLGTFQGRELCGSVCDHPLAKKGYDVDVPLLHGDFVTLEAGSGFVHIAPGHGEDDFRLGRKEGLEIPETVNEDGTFHADVPLFAGQSIQQAQIPIIEALAECKTLYDQRDITHSYPHSWRSGAPLIFRVTPQWFLDLDASGIRDKALQWIESIDWFPPAMQARIRSHVENRPDWCLSRQRSWGVPLAIFQDRISNEPLRDPKVMERVAQAFAEKGAACWIEEDPCQFLLPDHNPEQYRPVHDVLDVWFDSGSSFSYVLESKDGLGNPADLYLEGSDQHRGWFQSSLILSVATRGTPSYRQVLTHGFILDEKGRKMSKSLGNVIAPQDVVGRYGADVLRLWVMLSDSSEDLRMGRQSIDFAVNSYRRLRNSLRFLLGNLEKSMPADTPPMAVSRMPLLERWILHELHRLQERHQECMQDYRLHVFYGSLLQFCTVDLSAFYFDIRKDRLYCDAVDDPRRQACVWVLDRLFRCITAWLAPVLPFTAEEAFLARYKDIGINDPKTNDTGINDPKTNDTGQSDTGPNDTGTKDTGPNDAGINIEDKANPNNSIHRTSFIPCDAGWKDSKIATRMTMIRQLRDHVGAAMERQREKGLIRSSLEAHPVITAPGEVLQACSPEEWAEILIVSSLAAQPQMNGTKEPECVIQSAQGGKCPRCWRVARECVESEAQTSICRRCHDVTHKEKKI